MKRKSRSACHGDGDTCVGVVLKGCIKRICPSCECDCPHHTSLLRKQFHLLARERHTQTRDMDSIISRLQDIRVAVKCNIIASFTVFNQENGCERDKEVADFGFFTNIEDDVLVESNAPLSITDFGIPVDDRFMHLLYTSNKYHVIEKGLQHKL